MIYCLLYHFAWILYLGRWKLIGQACCQAWHQLSGPRLNPSKVTFAPPASPQRQSSGGWWPFLLFSLLQLMRTEKLCWPEQWDKVTHCSMWSKWCKCNIWCVRLNCSGVLTAMFGNGLASLSTNNLSSHCPDWTLVSYVSLYCHCSCYSLIDEWWGEWVVKLIDYDQQLTKTNDLTN